MNTVYVKYKTGEAEVIPTKGSLAVLLPKLVSDPRGLAEYSIRLNPMTVSAKRGAEDNGTGSDSEKKKLRNKEKKKLLDKEIKITGESLRDFCTANHMEYILDEWDAENNLPYTPDNIKPKSGHKVSWVCRNCGFQWYAPPATRANGSKCRRCKQ